MACEVDWLCGWFLGLFCWCAGFFPRLLTLGSSTACASWCWCCCCCSFLSQGCTIYCVPLPKLPPPYSRTLSVSLQGCTWQANQQTPHLYPACAHSPRVCACQQGSLPPSLERVVCSLTQSQLCLNSFVARCFFGLWFGGRSQFSWTQGLCCLAVYPCILLRAAVDFPCVFAA